MKTEVTVHGRYLRLHTGIIGLSEAQAKLRMHNLKKREDGRYDIVNPVEFKAGEVFDYEGPDLPRGYTDQADPTPAATAAAGGESSTGDSEPEKGKGKGKGKGK